MIACALLRPKHLLKWIHSENVSSAMQLLQTYVALQLVALWQLAASNTLLSTCSLNPHLPLHLANLSHHKPPPPPAYHTPSASSRELADAW